MTAVKARLTWITAHANRVEHAVTDEASDASRAGVFAALCGTSFLAAAMNVGPVRRCSGCERVARARTQLRDISERMGGGRRLRRARLLGAPRGRHAA